VRGSPSYLNPWTRYLPWAAGFLLIAGVVAFSIAWLGRDTSPSAKSQPAAVQQGSGAAQQDARKSVPFDPKARAVAVEFLQTAVPRKNLRAAWEIAHPELRQDWTLKRWLTGEIPVQYYPTGDVELATFKIDESYSDEAMIEVALLPPEKSEIKPQIFFVGLKKLDGKWLVNYFAPRSAISVRPSGDG
jgi:hypothetical protein